MCSYEWRKSPGISIQIIGMGHMGRQIAFTSLMKINPEVLYIHDIKSLIGDALDLQDSINALRYWGSPFYTKLSIGLVENPDFIVIAAGIARDPHKNKTMGQIREVNLSLLRDIVKNDVKRIAGANTQIIIVTNPCIDLCTQIQSEYTQYTFHHADYILRSYRSDDHGFDIVETKGYSDFAPSLAVIELMERLYNDRKKETRTG